MIRKVFKLFLNKIGIIKLTKKTLDKGYWIAGDSMNDVLIGKFTSFGGNVAIHANAPVTIGDHCMIARNAQILTSTHDYNEHPMWNYRIDRPVKIGSHVWIGAEAIILPGIIIEDFCVIGAGSVVAANVPKGAIVGGSPAKIIKYRNIENINLIQVDTTKYPGKIKKLDFKNNYCN